MDNDDNDNVVPFGKPGNKAGGFFPQQEEPRKLPVATYEFSLQDSSSGEIYSVVREGHLIASASALILLNEDGDVVFGVPFGQNVVHFDRLEEIDVDLLGDGEQSDVELEEPLEEEASDTTS